MYLSWFISINLVSIVLVYHRYLMTDKCCSNLKESKLFFVFIFVFLVVLFCFIFALFHSLLASVRLGAQKSFESSLLSGILRLWNKNDHNLQIYFYLCKQDTCTGAQFASAITKNVSACSTMKVLCTTSTE